ncbi:hypothetical protein RRG08_020484 [Elysia crispata]|uniref:Uncharacterized protein n=1 Tax=Elysia crispata TaxID=231223 RepID=A0AAE1DFU0_9GAST|nr:hypothetical protein RRG08_020484 [Elysia crispata]
MSGPHSDWRVAAAVTSSAGPNQNTSGEEQDILTEEYITNLFGFFKCSIKISRNRLTVTPSSSQTTFETRTTKPLWIRHATTFITTQHSKISRRQSLQRVPDVRMRTKSITVSRLPAKRAQLGAARCGTSSLLLTVLRNARAPSFYLLLLEETSPGGKAQAKSRGEKILVSISSLSVININEASKTMPGKGKHGSAEVYDSPLFRADLPVIAGRAPTRTVYPQAKPVWPAVTRFLESS